MTSYFFVVLSFHSLVKTVFVAGGFSPLDSLELRGHFGSSSFSLCGVTVVPDGCLGRLWESPSVSDKKSLMSKNGLLQKCIFPDAISPPIENSYM